MTWPGSAGKPMPAIHAFSNGTSARRHPSIMLLMIIPSP